LSSRKEKRHYYGLIIVPAATHAPLAANIITASRTKMRIIGITGNLQPFCLNKANLKKDIF